METLGTIIRNLRKEHKLPLREVADYLAIDLAILSKIERGKRNITRDQVIKLAGYFKVKEEVLLVAWLSDKIIYEIADEEIAPKALQAAEEKINYMVFKKTDRNKILQQLKMGIRVFPGIQKAWLYGSFARGDDGPGSDIDIVFTTDEGFSYFDLADVQFQLEKAVKRKVDVGFIDSFKPHIRKHVEEDLTILYERPSS